MSQTRLFSHLVSFGCKPAHPLPLAASPPAGSGQAYHVPAPGALTSGTLSVCRTHVFYVHIAIFSGKTYATKQVTRLKMARLRGEYCRMRIGEKYLVVGAPMRADLEAFQPYRPPSYSSGLERETSDMRFCQGYRFQPMRFLVASDRMYKSVLVDAILRYVLLLLLS